MSLLIKTVSCATWVNCNALGTDVNRYESNTNLTGIRAGSSRGITKSFGNDVGSGWYRGGLPEDKATFRGSNGDDHWMIMKLGASNGRYLNTHVTGLQFYEGNNSTTGHGMYIRRYCLETVNNSGSTIIWDLGGEMNRPGSYGKTHQVDFNSALLSNLASNYFISKFVVQVSTQGGSGSRDTSTTVESLKFKTATAPSSDPSAKLILPARRPYSQRVQVGLLA
jgi:hypothetical protein